MLHKLFKLKRGKKANFIIERARQILQLQRNISFLPKKIEKMIHQNIPKIAFIVEVQLKNETTVGNPN